MSCARSPSFPFIGLASKPGESVGTRKALIPFGPSPPVRANTIAVAAHEPSVMKTFEPVSTQPSPSLLGAGRERGGVGAAAGLGERVAAERLTAREPRQVRLPLRLRPPLRDRLAEQAVRDGDDAAHGRVRAAELLAEKAVRDRVEPAAAELLGQAGGEEPRLRQRRDERARQLLRLVPRPRVRHELALAELARRGANQLLLRCEREVHATDVGAVSGPHDPLTHRLRV